MTVSRTQVQIRAATARPPSPPVDLAALERDLRREVRGEVRFDAGARALYSTDGSNYRQIPLGVVLPLDERDVIAAVAACRAHGAPVLPRGNGTSLAGQTTNVAVVIDCSKHLREILEIDPLRRLARVQPGTVCDQLREQTDRPHRLVFGPDPSTHWSCTFGGMIGNNSCGVHAQMAGRTADNVLELRVLTYDGLELRVGRTSDDELASIIATGGRRGRIYRDLRDLRDRYADLIRARTPRIPRRVSGYNLDELLPENGFDVAKALVGTEGTCVTILEATVRLVYSPPARAVLLVGYPTIYEAADHLMEVLEHRPIGLEAMDDRLIADNARLGKNEEARTLLVPGGGWLLVEMGGDTMDEAIARCRELERSLARSPAAPPTRILHEKDQVARIWELRESGLGATALVPGAKDTWEGWEDSAVPPERMGDYLRELRKLYERFGYEGAFYGHFGQGCLHTRIDFDLTTKEGIARFRAFVEEAADLVVSFGGSLSGEHGDGQSRAELLPKMYGPELVQAFREFKAIWDPDGRMNPGKVVDPYRLDENLRLGAGYAPAEPATHFQFPDDRGSFARAAKRCVGVGKCRKTDKGVMCPSYMVTKDEQHTTRGRARMLFEMLQGDVVSGWKDEHVREALDLCLSCKGCKNECPVNVDMATYKAEFLSHYYEGRVRPRSAYAMGLIMYWARAAAIAPQLANLITRAPGVSWLAKRAAGIHPRRRAPAFAPQTFKDWFFRRPRRPDLAKSRRVILWPDTFNDHFHPEVARAAVEVLESAGFHVDVPRAFLCCGRPFYDYGMLDLAKHHLLRILGALREDIRAGVPVVGLEPSCIVVFKDELANLFPHDHDAKRLREQAHGFADFLAKHALPTGWTPPRLDGKAILQPHCHHRAVLGMDGELEVLRAMGLEVEQLDAGCCGMAGSFGFEQQHYDIAQQCGERVLIPRLRESPLDTLVVADGFSCKHQIEENTDRRALHVAEVIRMAMRTDGTPIVRARPEAQWRDGLPGFDRRRSRVRSVAIASVAVGLAALGSAWLLRRRAA